MPQIFQVLRCYKCLTFQVHQSKKSNKFSCKICDEKQSIKRHYAIGIAKDCRIHVQKLNKMRAENDETKCDNVSDEYEEASTSNSYEDKSDTVDNRKKTSKWLSYIDKQIEETDVEESPIISEIDYHENNKRWPRKKYQNYKTTNKIATRRRHCNVDDENDQNEVIENILDNDNTKNAFGKRPLFENGDKCRLVNKISKQTSHDTKLEINNSEFKDNLKDFTNTNKTPRLEALEVNKSSKWAQFCEKDEDVGEEICNDEVVKHISKNIQPLFSLCDESDIDDVLDI